MMFGNLVAIFLSLIVALLNSTNAVCPISVGKLSANGNDLDENADYYYLASGKAFSVDTTCCGFVKEFRYQTRANGTVQLMIWRPVGSDTYTLVGSESHTAIGFSSSAEPIVSTSIHITKGDCIGWYTSGPDMIPYNKKANNPSVLSLSPGTGLSTSGIVDWSAATSDITKTYAINGQISASTPPVFATFTTTYEIPDTTATGVFVTTVTFSDVDDGDSLTLTMNTMSCFTFTDNGDRTGTIHTSSSTPISSMSGSEATLEFTARDLCGESATGNISVTVPNSHPSLTNLPEAVTLLDETVTETRIASFSCSDATDDVSVTISINPSNAPAAEFFFSRFESGTSTNQAHGLYPTAIAIFNYTSQRDYTITIQCTDGKDPQTDTLVVHLVENQPPSITNMPTPTSVNVSTAAKSGDIVFTVLFDDPETDTVTLTHVCNPTTCPFDVLDSGSIQVTSDLDTVTNRGFDITVTPSDSKTNGSSRTLTVIIVDGPSFTNIPFTILVDENTPNPTSIYTVYYIAPVSTTLYTFTMGPSTLFSIDETSGVLSTKADINYETLTTWTYALPINLSDGRTSIEETLTVNITDVNEIPVWSSPTYRTSINEGEAPGTMVPDPGFSISDPDFNDTITCSMDCADENGYYSMSDTCLLTVSTFYRLDVGLPDTVNCNVEATDSGGNVALTTLVIDIGEVNNYSPVFFRPVYDLTMSAYADPGTSVGTVTAIDKDAGAYGTFSYSLNQTLLPANYFQINDSGVISAQVGIASACGCSHTTFEVIAYATDTGNLAGSSTVYITLGEYTTLSTTTSADRYMTFFDDTKNIAWFSLVVLMLTVTTCVTVFVLYIYVCRGPSLCRKPIKTYPTHELEHPRGPGVRHPPPLISQQVRRFPPPKERQLWRDDGSMRPRKSF